MALLTHFQTPITAKPLTRIEQNQVREPHPMSGFHLGTTWGPKIFCNFSSKCPAWAKCLIMACFPYMGSLLYTALYTAKSQGVHLLLPYLPVRQLCLQGGGSSGWMLLHTALYTAKGQGVHLLPPLPACEAAVVQSLPVCGSL